jgi:hypothetical protein
MPGAYPKNFSPYLLTNSCTVRAVQLTRTEIKNDLNHVHQAIAKECCSQYFDEVPTTLDNERIVDVTRQISSSTHTVQRRNLRRPLLSCGQPPMTEAEEKKQLRAALKASLAERANECDFQEYEKRTKNWDKLLKLEAMDGARLLRDVCDAHIFRTG